VNEDIIEAKICRRETTEIGYYGEPPPAFRKFFREFYKRVLNKKIEEKKFRKV